MASPNPSRRATGPLVVHETHRPPAPQLRYVDQVSGPGGAEVEFRFSRSVLTDFGVDVVHVVEPNLDLLLGTRGAGPVSRLLATIALTRNLRKHKIALVRTLPGVGRRGQVRGVASLAQRILDRSTSVFITFDETTVVPDRARRTIIPHAHFRDRFLGYPSSEMVPGRVLCLASDSPPGAAGDLIAIPRVVTTPGVALRLAGVADKSLEERIRRASARHPSTISVRRERLSDGARVQEIDAAELVIIPRMSSLGDLQTVFMALSRDRPVLVPHSEMLATIADDVGPGWVNLSQGPITAVSVDDALASTRARSSTQSPRLSGRDLTSVSASYASAFQVATARSRA